MSTWHTIMDKENITLSEGGSLLDILLDHDDFGNIYVEIPVELIKEVLGVGKLITEAEQRGYDKGYYKGNTEGFTQGQESMREPF
jgi:hypothetical protein